MCDKIPFFTFFESFVPPRDLGLLLHDACVVGGSMDRAERTMELELTASAPLPEAAVTALRQLLMDQYQLRQLRLHFRTPRPAEDKSDVLMGREIKGKPVSIDGLNPKMGAVVVEGKVFAAECYETRKPGVWRLTFDMTDYRNSVTVTKYMEGKEAQSMQNAVSPGMWLRVQGNVELSRDGKDIQLRPFHIMKIPHKPREDTAPEKRVELHLHTKMSNMDALTDTASVIKQAIAWGHPAIAITDHGVAQSFPDAWHAAGDKIKILYGVEGYFINNVDDRIAVHGRGDCGLDDEFVCFDIETTGLKVDREAITEIGAVVLKNGQVTDRFQTFVNPGRRLTPEIIGLTGITDAMLSDAPSPKEALTAFLSFVNGRPLAAHNAEFDISFIRAGCRREGIPFDPTYVDSLILAQNLLPELHKFKLDIVAEYLDLPAFNHHRASDDAATVGYMLIPFWKMLHERGIHTLQAVNREMEKLRPLGSKTNRFPKHIILLAKNKMGLKHLYQLISASNLQYFKRVPIIPKTELMAHREGLIVGSACEAGELFQAVKDHKDWAELRRIASFYDYLEIMPLANNHFLLDNGTVRSEESLRNLNRRIVQLGEELGKPVVATCDVHFLDPEQEIFRRILLAAKKFSDADKAMPLYYRTTVEMLDEFAYLGPEKAQEVVVTNTNAIADSVEVFELLPKDLYPPKIENSAQQLKDLVYGKMTAIYGENPPKLITDRVETELHDILSRGYDVIYMSAQKLVANSLEHGYLVGSRGSVGSSLVAYFSGITEVNSLPPHYVCPQCKYTDFDSGAGFGCGADMPDKVCPRCGAKLRKDGFDIPFETFLGFGGDKVPDIDLNFSGEYQAKAHKYTEELFGSDHVFRAGTIGTLAEKTAYGYVLKYLEERGKTLPKAEMNRLALGCVGVKRTTGQHPGGLVVIPQDKDVTDFCPVQHPADDPNSDIITTHFEYHCMEANLLKLDELGHDDPTMIRMLEDMTGVNAREIPLDDPDTMGIFCSAAPLGLTDDDPIVGKTGTIGIPEFGTGFTRQMLVDTQPKGFDILVRLSGFSHGTDVWLGNAKDLIMSGTATVNQTVGCRDDIMLYLISRGMDAKLSFKIMESVRKGKVKRGGFQDGWVETMEEHGVPEWYITSLSKIAYLFPKAHAVAYVMMAFRIAWFKVHEPLAFYSAYFYRRSQKDSFDADMMTPAARSTSCATSPRSRPRRRTCS